MTKHWLEQIAQEYNTTVYGIARDGRINVNSLYRIIQRESSLGGISIATADAIARGLGMTVPEFLGKYYKRDPEK
jgi:hypothetical protein